MRRGILSAFTCVLFTALAFSQAGSSAGGSTQPQPSGTPAQAAGAASAQTGAGQNANLATTPFQSGNIIYAELAKSLDAKKVKVGDEVQARVTQAALAQGRVVIPKGAKIMGHITEVSQRNGDQPSHMAFNFDHALLKDGTQVPLSVSVQALGGGTSAASMLDQSGNMGSNRQGMPSSSGMPGRPTASEAGGYGAPGGNMGGMSGTSAGAGSPSGGISTTDTSPSSVHLNSGSKGVVGLSGLSMSSGPQGTIVTSDKKNVKLDGGIELVLRTN
jgi:hypothetical protein